MLDLEAAIANWRHNMAGAGIHSPVLLDELEDHLREELRILTSSGTPECEAFQLALARLGQTEAVAHEFQKITGSPWKPLSIVALSGIVIPMAIGLLAGLCPGESGILLTAHVVTLTAGYSAALLAGSFGACYLCNRRLLVLAQGGRQSINRAALLSVQFSACLVLGGLIFGMAWSGQNRGHYLSGNPGEIGTFCAAAWLVASCLIQRLGRADPHVLMRLCVVGNVVISLAWFGAGAISHHYEIGSCWPLNLALAIHFLFLALDLLPLQSSNPRGLCLI
jgi:hypothetical protein